MNINNVIRKAENSFAERMKTKNVIIFESEPDYADNTRCVFDEMLSRKLNEKYTFIYSCHDKNAVNQLKNRFSNCKGVKFIYKDTRISKYYYQAVACCFIVCNDFYRKYKSNQHYIDLAHGCALKNVTGKYSLPDFCSDADIMTLSPYTAKYDAINFSCDVKNLKPLGYPRCDLLYSKKDLKKIFAAFDKFIYWLPTYRQHKAGFSNAVHSNISIPIIHNENEALKINDYLSKNNVLVIVKPHPQQDLSKIKKLSLGNIVFIDNDFLNKNNIQNYELLGNCDALLTDYSSVYYDYLLCNKPIGLCWEDFEQYNKREGFTVNVEEIMSAGEKIYDSNDFCRFVNEVVTGEDSLKELRENLRKLIHSHIDNQSTKRVVDYIESIL